MRKYVDQSFDCSSWESVEKYLQELSDRSIQNATDFQAWLKDKSELEAVLEENMAWRYIRMTIDTTNEDYKKSYQFFVTEIQPNLAPFEDSLNRKMLSQPWCSELENDAAYSIYFRSARIAQELYREENIPLETELNSLSQEYGGITGQQMITYNGKELTMPQAANFLKDTNEFVRQEVFTLIAERRAQDREKLDELFNKLVQLRHQIALNADCSDYRAYKFKALGRFDYSIEDCLQFHDAVAEPIVPLVRQLQQKQAKELGKEKLRPWDSEVDPKGKPALKPFENGEQLIEGTIQMFQKLDPYFASCLTTMRKDGYLDLDSKPGKAPGGYNYPLYECGIPFIFMNAAGAQRDLVTMVHEGGHAVHSFLSRDLELTGFKSLPSEVAELASMSMELLTMDLWDTFYSDADDLKRAQREQLEGIIKILPWIAMIDAFQHWIYTNPQHTVAERTAEWLSLGERFGTGMMDYSDFEYVKQSSWQRQLHLFEVPFYYIEYGIAQLGAIGVWKNFEKDSVKAIDQYKKALALGYTRSIPDIYKEAGLQFDFSSATLKELAEFIQQKLQGY
ncbi:MAG: M3 family oligoendopeptidase [Fluviicola sp.]